MQTSASSSGNFLIICWKEVKEIVSKKIKVRMPENWGLKIESWYSFWQLVKQKELLEKYNAKFKNMAVLL